MSEIKPALTPEEWTEFGRLPNLPIAWKDEPIPEEMRHFLATLLLHDQPFGFTWKDFDNVREAVRDFDRLVGLAKRGGLTANELTAYERWNSDVRDLADRIAALLPPRDSDA